jgi:hypothetical protein
MLILLILLILAFAGSGYGYYSRGAYASPLGIVGAILLVCLILWLIFGWGAVPPP